MCADNESRLNSLSHIRSELVQECPDISIEHALLLSHASEWDVFSYPVKKKSAEYPFDRVHNERFSFAHFASVPSVQLGEMHIVNWIISPFRFSLFGVTPENQRPRRKAVSEGAVTVVAYTYRRKV